MAENFCRAPYLQSMLNFDYFYKFNVFVLLAVDNRALSIIKII